MNEAEAEELKRKELDYWRAHTANWQKHHRLLNERAAPVTARMLALADVRRDARVLDIATGTGEPALTAAKMVGPGGWVLGTDFAEEAIAAARAEATQQELHNIEFRCVDGEQLELPPGSLDAVTIRWGLMFMPNPAACLRRVHRALRAGGKVSVACWAARDQNPWVNIPLRILRERLALTVPPPGTPGPFAFAEEGALAAALEAAGFVEVTAESVELTMAEADSADAYLTYLREIAGQLTTFYAMLAPEDRLQVDAEIAKAVSGPDGKVHLKGTTWVAAGRK